MTLTGVGKQMPTSTRLAAQPTLRPFADATLRFHGSVGERLGANTRHWLLTAPDANPAMLEMFRDRDREPARDLEPWAGEFAGKYLSAGVLALRLTDDGRVPDYLRSFVRALIATQGEDGYLGPFPRSRRLTGVGLWDVWGHYHAMLGLLLWHEATGDTEALACCRRAADLLCRTFLDGPQRVLNAGSEEMNQSVAHALLLLHQRTSEHRYLQLAREVEQDWETPPSGDYVRSALAGKPFWQCPKPRWESLHAVQAIAELYLLTGEARYREAFERIWWSIAEGDRHNTGGFSSGEAATGNPYHPGAIETCCTVAWMALSVDMLRLTGNPIVADELEWSTWNAALGAQHPSGRWWTYNTPMDGERKASAHDIVFQARAGSPELNCCSVNGPRALGMLAEWAVMQSDDSITLNYYGPASFVLPLPSGRTLRVEQTTDYPRSGSIHLTVSPEEPERFALRLRIPHWSERTDARVNGEPIAAIPGHYLTLDRTWHPGDTVELSLDIRLRAWAGERECNGKASLFRGPLLLAYDSRFGTHDPRSLPALDLARLTTAELPWSRPPLPFLLVKVPTADGQELTLCDFASAGAAGTHYISWLPAIGMRPQPFSLENPSQTRSLMTDGSPH
jgi:uncharacterized protein